MIRVKQEQLNLTLWGLRNTALARCQWTLDAWLLISCSISSDWTKQSLLINIWLPTSIPWMELMWVSSLDLGLLSVWGHSACLSWQGWSQRPRETHGAQECQRVRPLRRWGATCSHEKSVCAHELLSVWAKLVNVHYPSHTFRQDYPFYSLCSLCK